MFGGDNHFRGDLFVLPVSASGITQTQFSSLFFSRPANIVYTGGRVYGSSGEVVDVANPTAPVRATSLATTAIRWRFAIPSRC